jgi:hypothetical protein
MSDRRGVRVSIVIGGAIGESANTVRGTSATRKAGRTRGLEELKDQSTLEGILANNL